MQASCRGHKYTEEEVERLQADREAASKKLFSLPEKIHALREKLLAAKTDEKKFNLQADIYEFEDVAAKCQKILDQPEVKLGDFKGCGQDLTALIEALPVDGEDHEYNCPKCGATRRASRIPWAELPE